jgi:hypothetical protein
MEDSSSTAFGGNRCSIGNRAIVRTAGQRLRSGNCVIKFQVKKLYDKMSDGKTQMLITVELNTGLQTQVH